MRVDAELTQEEVATAIGITQRKYSYIETGTQLATEDFLSKLADFYDTSVDYILCRTKKKKPYAK